MQSIKKYQLQRSTLNCSSFSAPKTRSLHPEADAHQSRREQSRNEPLVDYFSSISYLMLTRKSIK